MRILQQLTCWLFAILFAGVVAFDALVVRLVVPRIETVVGNAKLGERTPPSSVLEMLVEPMETVSSCAN